MGGGNDHPVSCYAADSSGTSTLLGQATGYGDDYAWTVFTGSGYFTGVGEITVTCSITLGQDQGFSIDDISLVEVV